MLGIVENMSMHICSNCGHHEPIFGTGGAEKLAAQYHTQLLGQMPLHITLREDLIAGNRRSSTARTVSLRSCTVSWRGALRRSFTGRVKSFPAKSPSARCNSSALECRVALRLPGLQMAPSCRSGKAKPPPDINAIGNASDSTLPPENPPLPRCASHDADKTR